MARTLETLDLGTPVFCGEERVGDVRGLYAEGTARAVEWVVVDWVSRGEVAVPATKESLNAGGIDAVKPLRIINFCGDWSRGLKKRTAG